ncbi:amidase family protein [Arthrobacter cupressi]|uniref:Amidase n=1 Tax=Arthrobacter cupressi TaxID=1045773 RepID=A0A1G8JRI8_9MICC|nr:amidase family protein [Arthrobacter cupressi]NYD77453.1 amidase [Arthrobacter cupressi]SDI33899.1 amidase [Arthrobacter cupressi]
MTNELVYRGAVELAALLRSREVSAVEVLEAHLEQIDRLNPLVNAVVTMDEDGARAAAAEADRRLAAGVPTGPLHGLPISFKDTAQTAGMRTTFGHPRHADFVPGTNDLHVQRILDAGAIRVGKTNVPEYAAGSHTFNRLFGATRNPYDPSKSAGGSSGGAAAALASGFQPIADGSDMGGSLRNPASFCNVVGLRPTPGMVPNTDGGNVFFPLGVAGPMGRTAEDAALLFSAMRGATPDDPFSFFPAEETHAGEPSPQDFAGLRIAYAPTLGGRIPVAREVLDVLDPQAKVLAELGAHVELDCPDLDGSEEVFRVLRAASFHAAWGDDLDADPGLFNHFLAGNIRDGAKLSGRDVFRAEEGMTRLIRKAAEFFTRYDLVIAPASQLAPFDADLEYPTQIEGQQLENYLDWMRAPYLFTPLGLPALSVPAGFTPSGLPVGLQMIGARGSDVRLLRLASAFEQLSSCSAVHPQGAAVL